MNQELTVSSNIVDYLASELPDFKKNNAHDCIEYIEQNYFVLDDKRYHIASIIEKIDNLTDINKKNNLGEIVVQWLTQKSKIYKSDDNNLPEFHLALQTTDRIYFDPFLQEKEINKIKKKYDLEVHNTNSFVNPSPYERLKHSPTSFYLESDCIYDLNLIFEPFLRQEKNITVIDPYLPNKLASYHFIKLLEQNMNKCFSLVFLKKDIYPNPVDYDVFESKIREFVKEGFSIELNLLQSKKHQERFIITDNYQIYLPGGFDCLDLNGMPKIKNAQKERLQIRIEKRKPE